MTLQISVIGLGKAGLPLAAVIADAGIRVLGIDSNEVHVSKINSKNNPIPEEPGLQELLQKHVPDMIKATTRFEEARSSEAYIVIVPLFVDQRKNPDFSILKSAFTNVAKLLKKGDLVVLETTVPPKTTETIIKNVLEENSGLIAGKDFYLAHSPERIMTGYSLSRYREFPKIVGGINPESTQKAFDLYTQFCSKVFQVKDCKTAEFMKVAEGIYRDVNIALANELYQISQGIGVDFWEMREKANHQFCNIHEAGIGVGGHCIPVYPWFLIKNYRAPLIRKAREVNDAMVDYLVDKVKERKAKNVLIIGLAYREKVKGATYARSIVLIKKLKKEGFHVWGLDPLYTPEETGRIFGVDHLEDFSLIDAIIVANNNQEYADKLKEHQHKIIGVKNIFRW